MERFDLIVIGAGPGGYNAALQAAKLGKKVALFEEDKVGGTCLNRGCIPTKTLLRSARIYEEAKNSVSCGICAESVTYDMEQLHENMDTVITTLRGGIDTMLNKQKVVVIPERAKVLSPNTVEAAGTLYETEKILLAMGSKSLIPSIPGIESEGIHTVEYFLEQPVDTKSLIIVGGGVVGVEIAQVYQRLGCKVTIIEGMQRLLPNLDREIGQSLAMNYKKRGINVITNGMVSSFETTENGVICHYTDKKKEILQEEAEKILISIGRRANTEGVIADAIDLQMSRGFIPVDENCETVVKGIYAIGDIVLGSTQLAHAAEAQGANAVQAMFGKKNHKNMKYIPACVFTDPEIATVGLSADEAKQKDIAAYTVKKLTSSNGRSLIEEADRGFVKLTIEKETDKLLGAVLMCTHAGEMIGGLTIAIANGVTLEELESTIFPHPTISEVIVS